MREMCMGDGNLSEGFCRAQLTQGFIFENWYKPQVDTIDNLSRGLTFGLIKCNQQENLKMLLDENDQLEPKFMDILLNDFEEELPHVCHNR